MRSINVELHLCASEKVYNIITSCINENKNALVQFYFKNDSFKIGYFLKELYKENGKINVVLGGYTANTKSFSDISPCSISIVSEMYHQAQTTATVEYVTELTTGEYKFDGSKCIFRNCELF